MVGVDGEALEGGRALKEVLRPAASHTFEVVRRGKKGGGEAAGGRGARPAERGRGTPAHLVTQDQLPPRSPPPSPPPASPPPYNPSDTPRLGQARASAAIPKLISTLTLTLALTLALLYPYPYP